MSTEAVKKTQPRPKFNWEYCECGCHQHALTIAGLHFTSFNDLQGGHWYAEGHNARYRDPKNRMSSEVFENTVVIPKLEKIYGELKQVLEPKSQYVKGLKQGIVKSASLAKRLRGTIKEKLIHEELLNMAKEVSV